MRGLIYLIENNRVFRFLMFSFIFGLFIFLYVNYTNQLESQQSYMISLMPKSLLANITNSTNSTKKKEPSNPNQIHKDLLKNFLINKPSKIDSDKENLANFSSTGIFVRDLHDPKFSFANSELCGSDGGKNISKN